MKKPPVATIPKGVARHTVGARRVDTRRAAKAVARVADVAKPAAVAKPAEVAAKAPLKINPRTIEAMRVMGKRLARKAPTVNALEPYVPPPGVLPKGKTLKLAMDETIGAGGFAGLMEWGGLGGGNAMFDEGIGFLGYSYLAQLTQRPEYRRMSERIATEMTRKWIKFHVVSEVVDDDSDTGLASDRAPGPPAAAGADPLDDEGEGPEVAATSAAEKADADKARVRDAVAKKSAAKKAKRIKELEDELRVFHVKDHFYNLAEQDGWFGRSHLFADVKLSKGRGRTAVELDVDSDAGKNELATSIGNGRNATSIAKVTKGSLRGFRVVEPMWCYPATYDAQNPLKGTFYHPNSWYVNGIEVHRSRLLTFVGREVPDILKPAYAFGGLSLSQMAKPYVDNWLRTRQAVADLIESFSVSGIYTNMAATIQDGGDEAIKRMELFNITRTNAGAFMLDKDTEEFFNVSTPLGTLDALQAQSQEQLASVSGIPLIILLGITPQGLNASSEGEIRSFYDFINAYQESFFRDHLQAVIHFVMLHLWGEIDEEITFEFEPLWSMTDKEKAEIQKLEAETDQVRIDSGVIDPGEARKALAAQPESRYSDINPEDVPEPQQDPMGEGGDQFGGDGEGDAGGDPGASAADRPVGAQDEWNESDHPRADDGKFGSGGSSSSSKSAGGTSKAAGASNSSKYKTAGKPSWNGGTLDDPATMETGTLESNARALRHAIKNSPFTAVQRAKREERLADIDAELKERAGKDKPAAGGKLDVSKLKKQGGKLGSNEGGVYTDDAGGKFYVKKPATKAHVANEMAAARLYQLAGVNTLNYRDAGPDHVATEWQELDKNNISKFTAAEKKAAAADFAVHAWLSNWDAAGTGGDNQGIKDGKPTTLDVGGSLRYRAQGGPKGGAFGKKVTELDTMRDKSMSPDAARLFGSMSDADLKASVERVTSIPDDKIREAVGDDKELADTLIARKQDMAKRFDVKGAQDEALMQAALDAAIEDQDEDMSADAAQMATALQANSGVPIDSDDDEDEDEEVRRILHALGSDDDEDGVTETAPDVFAMDEENFDESKHKRDKDGKFSSTGGGGGAKKDEGDELDNLILPGHPDHPDTPALNASKAAAAQFKTKKEHIAHLLTQGTTPKELMQTMGWPSVSMPAQAQALGMKLEKKDGKYYGTPMTDAEKAAAKEAAKQKAQAKKGITPETLPGSPSGQPKTDWKTEFEPATDYADFADKMGKYTGVMKKELAEFHPTFAKKYADSNEQLSDANVQAGVEKAIAGGAEDPFGAYPSFLGQIAEAIQDKDFAKIQKLFAQHPDLAAKYESTASEKGKAAIKAVLAKPTAAAPKATPEELKKAAKSTTLPINTTAPAAVLLIQEFNDKYAGKDNLTPEQLNQKVQDFKDLKAITPKLVAEYEAASKAEKAAAEKAALAEAKKKKAEALAKQKAEMEEAFAKDPTLKVHYEAAEALFGGKDAGPKFAAQAAAKVKSAGLSKYMTAADAIPIIAYSGSHYASVNQQLRTGKMTEAQDKFRQSLNAGLDKLPSHSETTYRKASLTPEQAAHYEPGYVIEERGFMSTSKNQGTWSGSHQFTVHGKNGKDIQKLSSHPGEAEVLFKSGSRFKVISNNGQHIVLQEV